MKPTGKEARQSVRAVFRCRAKVLMKGGAALQGKTLDISLTGISLVVPAPVPVGETCMIMFDVMLDGQVKEFNALANAVYSICVTDGFRIGFQFASLNAGNTAIVQQILM